MKVSFKYLHCIYASESVQVQMSLCCLPKQVAQAAVKVHSVWRLPSAMALNMSRWASFSERRWSITPPATENGVWLPGSSPMGNWHHRYVLYIKTVCKGKKITPVIEYVLRGYTSFHCPVMLFTLFYFLKLPLKLPINK